MNRALFDSITNSEDEMILRTGIKRYHVCTYLRAYIMTLLCFEPRLVISDSAVNLNRAFRTLISIIVKKMLIINMYAESYGNRMIIMSLNY